MYDKKSKEELIKIIEELEKKKLQEQNKFISNISHEIRTPLNGIFGVVQLLKETDLDDKQKEYLEILFSSTENLMDIVDRILKFNKSEKYKVKAAEFSLSKLVKDIVKMYEIELENRNIECNVIFPPELPIVLIGDEYLVKQILLNLIDNAIKFTNTGKITIKIDLIKISKTKINIKILIRDTGIGIEERHYKYIFGNFNKLEKQTVGAGLGLSLVKRFVKLLNGKIYVDSIKGQGTDFILELGFSYKESKKNIFDKDLNLSHHKDNKRKILIAEDELVGRITLKFMLKDYYDLVFAKNGKECIKLYKKEKPDLVLMDIMMPGMNGFEALDMIEKEFKNHSPIIACTAKVIETEKNYLKSYGFSDYLEKPINMKNLFTVINKNLNY